MKTLSLPIKGLLKAIAIAGISFATLLGQQPTLADTGRSILQDLDPQRGNDPLGPRSDEVDSMGLFDLIHRFNQGSTTWDAQQQDQQLNDATAAFRKKQEQMLQQQGIQQQNQPVRPVTGNQ
ncbi:hypothetical protein F7734_48590 [Scytonema sp. UIC 10036]|uniref:hypothetical protein n=1 Tax=Scytonema sp. UIC 10036 TaxID=2304196 RepID=UPI0012DA8174|nr:hypothetical protein [Scytonema sp. UIC 10036]MUG99729.1 hypothetical protein [Scytonema sp. UIC 10036]